MSSSHAPPFLFSVQPRLHFFVGGETDFDAPTASNNKNNATELGK
jgi:hypothetical protein